MDNNTRPTSNEQKLYLIRRGGSSKKASRRVRPSTYRSIETSQDVAKSSLAEVKQVPQKTSSPVAFRPIPPDELLLSPLEDALINGKRIAFYIPSLDYQESALYMLDRFQEMLTEEGISFPKPNYELVVAEKAPGWNGDLDEKERVIIHAVGAARLG